MNFIQLPRFLRLGLGVFILTLSPLYASDPNSGPVSADPNIAIDTNPVRTNVVDLEEQAGPWMYGKRKGDPLALPMDDKSAIFGAIDPESTRLKIFFRERKIATKSAVDPSAGRDINISLGNEQEPAKARERGTMLAVSRYRELPLDEIGGPIDLTNVLKSQNPKNKDGKFFYFVPLGRHGAQQLKDDSSTVWEEAPAPKQNVDDVVLHYSQDLPWDVTKPGTLMHYANQKVGEAFDLQSANVPEESSVIFATWKGNSVKVETGGELRRVSLLSVGYMNKVKMMVLNHPYRMPSIDALDDYNPNPSSQITGDESLSVEKKKLEDWILSQPEDTTPLSSIFGDKYAAYWLEVDRIEEQIKNINKMEFSFDASKAFVVKPGGVVLDLRQVVPYQGMPISFEVEPHHTVMIDINKPEHLAKFLIEMVQKALDKKTPYYTSWQVPRFSPAAKTAIQQGIYYPPYQPDIERRPLVVAYQGNGHGPLIVKGGSLLSGPIQIVTDQPMILVGNMGASDQFNNPVIKQKLQEIYNWMREVNDARWRLITPAFRIASVASAQQVELGQFGPLPGPEPGVDVDALKQHLANLKKQKKDFQHFLDTLLLPLQKDLKDGNFASIQDAIDKKNALQAKAQNEALSAEEQATLDKAIALEQKTQGANPPYPPKFIPKTSTQLEKDIQVLEDKIKDLDQEIADLEKQIADAQP